MWLASNGGGIGTYWGEVRSIGETVKKSGQLGFDQKKKHLDFQEL